MEETLTQKKGMRIVSINTKKGKGYKKIKKIENKQWRQLNRNIDDGKKSR